MAVTLKDIAERLGVTTTTVHRALHGKEGVSEETRDVIQRTAAEMGYRANYMAASLKRKNIKLAIVMPEPTFDNKYYYNNLWEGAKSFLEEVREFNIAPLEFAYPLAHGTNGAMLKEVYEKYSDDLNGILTMAVDHPQSSFFIEKFAEKRIPIAFVGSDLYKDKRFCCVKTYDEMAGSLAAELLTSFNKNNGAKQALAMGHFGQLGMKDQQFNISGFEQYIRRTAPNIIVRHIQGEDSMKVRNEIEEILKKEPVFAIYSSSARYTIHMAEAVKAAGVEGKVILIGNDIFPESVELLKAGTLSAIIDKKIQKQSYLAMKTIFNLAVKGEYPRSSILHVKPEVALKSNYLFN